MRQSRTFWSERKLHTPDWWGQLPLVPFRELCADELSGAVAKYLRRQCGAAAEKLAAHLQRKRELSPVASVEYRWSGRVRHGPESLAALDTYVSVAVANNRLVGGRQGAWLIADFHASSVRPAMQALVTADVDRLSAELAKRALQEEEMETDTNQTAQPSRADAAHVKNLSLNPMEC